MRPKHLVSIVLIAVVLVMLMRNNNSMTNARPLVYRESLDEVAAQINGEKLTLRDMAFYVGYEEYQIQQEALVYDPDDPNRYWSMRVEGGFMNAVARKNAMQMALHDELFYQMAMEEGITLDDNDQKHMDNKLEDFWEDLTERQGETALGISRKDAKKTIQRIAYAQKYQEVYATIKKEFDDYTFIMVEGPTSGEYIDGTIYVTYYYDKNTGTGDIMPPQTGFEPSTINNNRVEVITLYKKED